MIFCAKNEDGVSTYDLVLKGIKTVTRRDKPLPVGKVFAVQSGRGKKAGRYAKVIDCESHTNFRDRNKWFFKERYLLNVPDFDIEASKEGFKTWEGLLNYFTKRGKDINDTYRIKFELIKEEKQVRKINKIVHILAEINGLKES